MTRLNWGGTQAYETGVDHGVFYPKGGTGVVWSGLVAVNDTTVDASQSLIYIDGVGHQNQLLIGNFSAVVEAITYPEEFEPYDGYDNFHTGGRRRRFDFSYRTLLGEGHYQIHLVYNAVATPTQRNHSTMNTAQEVELFSWEIATRPEVIPDAKASSHFVLDTRYVYPEVLTLIEDRLYGTDASLADMPTATELLDIFWDNARFRVTDNGDGTATIIGDDDAVSNVGVDLWRLEWPSVIQQNSTTYRVSSF